jgi:outer membrane protein assembly factor BamB
MMDQSSRGTKLAQLFTVFALAGSFAALAGDTDWPQYRGPNRDGVSSETGLLDQWSAGGPKELWRTSLGRGFSGISVSGGRIYTMFAEGSDEFVVCLDAATGQEIWRKGTGSNFNDRFGDGPRSTPTVDGELVFALGAKGKLHALGATDGQPLWSRDLPGEFGAEIPRWGYSSAPLVDGKLLLVDVGGQGGSSIVAFDKKTGKEVWRSQNDKAGYSAPVVMTVSGRRQVVFFTGTTLVSLAPEDGTLLWRQAWKTSYDVNAATPIFIPPDKLFVSSGYDVGAAVYRVKMDGRQAEVQEVWRTREMKNKFSSSVLHEGHLYGFDEKTFKCIDAATGETKWKFRGLGHGSLIFADGHLVVLGDEGTLVLVEATAAAYREQGRAQIFDGKTWTVPTLSGGKLYLRDEKQLVSLDVSG